MNETEITRRGEEEDDEGNSVRGRQSGQNDQTEGKR